jgi:plasmid stability protein
MATLTVRKVNDEIYQGLKAQAAQSGRSMEAEAREIIGQVVQGRLWWSRWVEATEALRGDDLPVPARSAPRETPL